MRRALALALALPLGCRPSLAQLDHGHHYDEALCGVKEGAFPKDQVAKVIRRALDPALHIAVVPREQLAAAVGDHPELDRVALLRLTRDSNTIPLTRFYARVALRRGERSVALAPTFFTDLVATFEEKVPGPRTVGPGTLESAGHALKTLGAIALAVGSLGIFSGPLRRLGPAPTSRTIHPTEAEIRSAAPQATRLHDAVAHLQTSCPDVPGARCHTLTLVPRAPDDATADLALAVDLHYAAPCDYEGIHEEFTIPLPPGPTLDARLAALFGPDMRRLSELAK